jgi:hypothetical protein
MAELFVVLLYVLGAAESISVHDALYAVTLDSAHLLKLEHEIGRFEKG